MLVALHQHPALAKRGIELSLETIAAEDAPADDVLARLFAKKPDILYATTTSFAAAARRINANVPIVFSGTHDPVTEGLVESPHRPGRNMTGFSLFSNSDVKRIEILKRALPRAKRVAVLKIGEESGANRIVQHNIFGANIDVLVVNIRSGPSIQVVCAQLAAARIELLDLQSSAWLRDNHVPLIACLNKLKIASMFKHHGYVELGGLMSYGTGDPDFPNKAAKLIARIFSGENAGDIPVEYPTEFTLALNLQTAKQFSPDISPAFLKQVNKFYEP
ncbi:MAG: hypothetical protein LH481_04420 [Burkholderiales bacterium]|nr:hypothetical protein [Burkholderiales bacterium]